MEIVVELYVCEKCSHVELELNGVCPECGGEMECVDFVPKAYRGHVIKKVSDTSNSDGEWRSLPNSALG